ncbi:hypothetical protein [Leptolyngbya sp. FACHB-321]|uniref:hypothetical protein n=1 Tax=Leptolyngbya sp. FACHB-321 TaxID=2692807 RepID=UPI001F552121|nr:hypothetical protein [Leptolyngbya sp. FACHB-321]
MSFDHLCKLLFEYPQRSAACILEALPKSVNELETAELSIEPIRADSVTNVSGGQDAGVHHLLRNTPGWSPRKGCGPYLAVAEMPLWHARQSCAVASYNPPLF